MTDRPILFSAPMIRALLDGRKTQTRRIIKPQPTCDAVQSFDDDDGIRRWVPDPINTIADEEPIAVRFAKGDRLWVRETLRRSNTGAWHYVAGLEEVGMEKGDSRIPNMLSWAHHKEGDTCVSIHMPRWASRLTLTVTDVRVERLQAISEADAIAEGAREFHDIQVDGWTPGARPSRWSMEQPPSTDHCLSSARWAFAHYFAKLNGERVWNDNPWIVALTFSVMKGNIDAARYGCGARSAEPAPNPPSNS